MGIELLLRVGIAGAVTGASYALVAIGIVLVMGILRVLNFAHGELYMLGGYFALTVTAGLGLPYVVALLIAPIGVSLVGLAVSRIGVLPLVGRHELSAMLALFGIGTVISGGVQASYGAYPKSLASPFVANVVQIGFVRLTQQDLLLIAVAGVAIALFFVVLESTTIGRVLRATAQNRTGATLVGIDVPRVYLIAFTFGAAFAAVAGVFIGASTALTPSMGLAALFKGFVIMVLGGITSLEGAVVVGLGIGILEALISTYITSELRDLVIFAILIGFLLLRPYGLFGRRGKAA